MPYGDGNPGPSLRQTHIYGWGKAVNEIPPPPPSLMYINRIKNQESRILFFPILGQGAYKDQHIKK